VRGGGRAPAAAAALDFGPGLLARPSIGGARVQRHARRVARRGSGDGSHAALPSPTKPSFSHRRSPHDPAPLHDRSASLTRDAAAAAAVATDLDGRLAAARAASASPEPPPGATDTLTLLELAAAEARRRAAAAATAAMAAGAPPPPAGGWHPPRGGDARAAADDGLAALAAAAARGATPPNDGFGAITPPSGGSGGSTTSAGRPVHCVLPPDAAPDGSARHLPSLGRDDGFGDAAVRAALAGLALDGYGVGDDLAGAPALDLASLAAFAGLEAGGGVPPALADMLTHAPPPGWPAIDSGVGTHAPAPLGQHDYHCPVCGVTCCGHANFEEHCASRRHLRKVAAVSSAALASAGGAPPPPPRAASRPYVRQVITPELNRATVDLLTRLLTWQDAARASLPPLLAQVAGVDAPLPLCAGRRLVSGLRDIARCVRAGATAAVIVAPNVEPAPADGGEDLLASVLTAAVAAGSPIVFALSRKKLGQVFGVRKKMTAVAVVDAAGADDALARVLALAGAGRAEWARLEAGGGPLPPSLTVTGAGTMPPPPRGGPSGAHALFTAASPPPSLLARAAAAHTARSVYATAPYGGGRASSGGGGGALHPSAPSFVPGAALYTRPPPPPRRE